MDKYLTNHKNLEKLTDRPAKLQERIFTKLFKQAEIANYSEQEYNEYENSLKAYRDLKNSIDTAFSDGEKKGRAKGKEEGREEGEKIGLQKTAKNMKQAGFELAIIAQVTGLNEVEIKDL